MRQRVVGVMSRLVVATAAVCALSLVGAGGARAAIVVDQSNLVDTSVGALGGSGIRAPSTSFPFGTRQVQTVTAGLDGDLARLDLQVFKFGKLGTLRASLYDGDYARAKGMFSPPGSPGGFGVLITTTLTSLADFRPWRRLKLGDCCPSTRQDCTSTFTRAKCSACCWSWRQVPALSPGQTVPRIQATRAYSLG